MSLPAAARVGISGSGGHNINTHDNTREWVVDVHCDGERLDSWLADRLGTEASRTLVQRWIKAGLVAASGPTTPGRRVRAGESYRLAIPPHPPSNLEPVDLQLVVIYEDADCAVIHKPPGIAVHPGPGDRKTTLANGIVHRWQDLTTESNPASMADRMRPGIVHRLDRDTEGLLLVAKHDRARRLLMALFLNREVRKEYTAFLLGNLPRAQGRVELALRRNRRNRLKMQVERGGRMAVTEFAVEQSYTSARGRKFYRVQLNLLTGRTHQIRVHMAHLGAPVVGDVLYSRSAPEFERFGMLLLAQRLSFRQPISGELVDLSLDLPARFREFEHACVNL
jgi:23S rRNA pseudouridine1911/1915/1917 synthase